MLAGVLQVPPLIRYLYSTTVRVLPVKSKNISPSSASTQVSEVWVVENITSSGAEMVISLVVTVSDITPPTIQFTTA